MSENIQGISSTNISTSRPVVPAPSYIGPELKIKGHIDGDEDVKIDGKIVGPISLGNHRLTLGQSAQVLGDIHSGEIVVFGDVKGNLIARDRVDVRRDASVTGDLTTSRITIEDGAHVKGAIEINWESPESSVDPSGDLALAVKKFKMKRAGGSER